MTHPDCRRAASKRPRPVPVADRSEVALVVIDMQRDFLLPGGFGETLGNDVSQLAAVVPPLQRVLAAARAAGLMIIHTREGHRPDLSDLPRPSTAAASRRCGSVIRERTDGSSIRGEYGHDIIDELAPDPGEIVIDKPGKGSFYGTDLDALLAAEGITQFIVTGVTTEVCVHTTVREANDRGYEVLVLSDCVGSYFPEFQRIGLDMIAAQGGIFGWVADSTALLQQLEQPAATAA